MTTPAEILIFFQKLVDDETADADFVYQLLTQAKNKIEDELELEILKGLDTSKTNAVGDTYLTMKALPTDFRKHRKLSVGQTPFTPIPFEHREQWKDNSFLYYTYYKNSQYAICGRGTGQTINLFYWILTDDLETDNETVAVPYWPKRFLPLIAYEAAFIMQSGIDADAMAFRMSNTQIAMRTELRSAMVNWNSDLQLQSMNGRGGFAENVEGDYPINEDGSINNLGNM